MFGRLIPPILLAAGAALLIGAVVSAALTARFVARAASAQGTVVALDTRQSGGSRSEVTIFPIVAYRPAGTAERRFRGEGSGSRQYRVGDRVDVLYLPDPPRDPRITGVAAVWARAAGLLFAGVLMLMTGLLARHMAADRGSQDDEDEDADRAA